MSVQTTYPEVYLSTEVDELLSSLPPLPEPPVEPREPAKPVPPTKSPSEARGCAWFLLISVIIGFIVVLSRDEIIWEGVVACVLFSFMAYFMFLSAKDNKESDEKNTIDYNTALANYPALLAEYEKKKEEYQIQLNKYNRSIRTIRSKNNISKYRKKQIDIWKTHRKAPIFMDCDDSDIIKKGVSEAFLSRNLARRYSPGSTLTDKKVPVGLKYYYPDIVFVYNNLYFDIEIDEPYVGDDGSPIHYLEECNGLLSSVDKERNEKMNEMGWEVIRFSEEQVLWAMEECLHYIEEVITSIDSGNKPSIKCSFSVKKPTKEEAYNLAYHKFRSTYLPPAYLNNIDQDE